MHLDPDVHLFLHRTRVAEAMAARREPPVARAPWWRRRGRAAGHRAPVWRWAAR
jgi:hypothetical protein